MWKIHWNLPFPPVYIYLLQTNEYNKKFWINVLLLTTCNSNNEIGHKYCPFGSKDILLVAYFMPILYIGSLLKLHSLMTLIIINVWMKRFQFLTRLTKTWDWRNSWKCRLHLWLYNYYGHFCRMKFLFLESSTGIRLYFLYWMCEFDIRRLFYVQIYIIPHMFSHRWNLQILLAYKLLNITEQLVEAPASCKLPIDIK